MGRPFPSNSSQVEAAFPGTALTLRELLDRRDDHDVRLEIFNVPGSDYSYTWKLDHGVLEQIGFTVVDTTPIPDVPLIVVGWDENPGPDEVAINYDRGLLRFHNSLGQLGTEHQIEVQYTPLGSNLDVEFLHWLQKEIRAAQLAIVATAPRSAFLPGVPGTDRLLARILVEDNGSGSRTLARLTAFANDTYALGSGDTTLYVTTAATATGGQAISLPTIGTDDAKRWANLVCNLAIDTSAGPVALNIFCTSNTGGHGNITLEAFLR